MIDQGAGSGKRLNPILEAKRKKEMQSSPALMTSSTSDSNSGNRNPFKKTVTPKGTPRWVRVPSDFTLIF